jgi:hypothetical protein
MQAELTLISLNCLYDSKFYTGLQLASCGSWHKIEIAQCTDNTPCERSIVCGTARRQQFSGVIIYLTV